MSKFVTVENKQTFLKNECRDENEVFFKKNIVHKVFIQVREKEMVCSLIFCIVDNGVQI